MLSRALFPFSVDIFCLHRKFLVYNLVSRNLKLKYRQSAFGFIWTLAVPAASAAIYYFVFQYVMKVSIPNYLLFVLSGLLPWTFYSTALTLGMESIANNYGLVNKVPIPVFVFPFTEVLTSFLNLLFSVPIVVLVALLTQTPVTWAALITPLLLALLFLQAYGLAILLAIGYAYFRDLRHAMVVVIQLWFYATPVLYTADMIPANGKFILWINPVAMIFHGIQSSFVFGRILPWPELACALIWSLGIFLAGTLAIRKTQSSIVEML